MGDGQLRQDFLVRDLALIPQHDTIPGMLVYASRNLADVLAATEAAGLAPQYAPEVARYRSNAPTDNGLWEHTIVTPSIRATGRTKAGSKVVVYAHVPNYYTQHDHLRRAITRASSRERGIPLPQQELDRLVRLDGYTDERKVQRVWVLPYDRWDQWNPTETPQDIPDALENPHVVAFLGSEMGARAYLQASIAANGSDALCLRYSDDFDSRTPRARLLAFGHDQWSGLIDNYHLHPANLLVVPNRTNKRRRNHQPGKGKACTAAELLTT